MRIGFHGLLAPLLAATATLHAAPALPGTEVVEVKKDFVEPLSKIKFPLKVGAWQGINVIKYLIPPRQHSVSYEWTVKNTGTARATGYVFADEPPVPTESDEHFRGYVEVILSIPGSALVQDAPVVIPAKDGGYRVRMAVFAMRNGVPGISDHPMISMLFLFRPERYWMRWRFSFPAGISDQAIDQALKLMTSLTPK